MYWKGYIEKVGTGTEDIIEKCRDYGLKTPEFYQEEDFRVVIWRAAKERQSDPKEVEALIGLIKSEGEICEWLSGNKDIPLDILYIINESLNLKLDI